LFFIKSSKNLIAKKPFTITISVKIAVVIVISI
jgi:hypothetical protein